MLSVNKKQKSKDVTTKTPPSRKRYEEVILIVD